VQWLMADRLTSMQACWLVGLLDRLLAGRLAGCMAGKQAVQLSCEQVRWLAGWLAGALKWGREQVGWLAWLADWMAGLVGYHYGEITNKRIHVVEAVNTGIFFS
jgi:hypothetical protein